MIANVEPFVAAGRELHSWIEGFIQLTDSIQSPLIFRKWTAISAISAVMERKVWVRSQGRDIYPNLYVFLVGPPGGGKTSAIAASVDIWRELDTHKLARTSLTKASLMDEMALAHRVVHTMPQDYNSMYIASEELSSFIPAYDPDMLSALTTMFDCRKYDEKRRGNKDPLVIERPQISLLAGTTPGYLVGTMPIGAWEQGFLARVIIVYSAEIDIKPFDLMEEHRGTDKTLTSALAKDMKKIGERVGRLYFTRPAAEVFESWLLGGREPEINHPRLIHYSTRRPIHLLKLCMVSAVDRGADKIDVSDVQCAQDWLFEAEHYMPEVFLAMHSGGDAAVINEVWHYTLTFNVKNSGGGLPLHMFHRFLQSRLPAYSIQKVYEVMTNSKMIRTVNTKDGPVIFGNSR